jgi:hypothetical protein
MQMLEVGYSVRNSCDYIVGSEESEPGRGWPYNNIVGDITAASTPVDVCNEIVNEYHNQGDPTQSAIATSGLDALAGEVDVLATAMIANMATEQANITAASTDPALVFFAVPSFVDLGHLCELLKIYCTAAAIKDATDDVRAALAAVVIANETNGERYVQADGLSIYFPAGCGDEYYQNYLNLGPDPADLDFVADTNWDEFLLAYIGGPSAIKHTTWGGIKGLFQK